MAVGARRAGRILGPGAAVEQLVDLAGPLMLSRSTESQILIIKI